MSRNLICATVVACMLPASMVAAAEKDDEAPRPYHQIHEDLTTLLKLEATASSKNERVAAIHEMLPLYREIVEDPRRRLSPTLERYRIQLRARLIQCQARIKREIARRGNNTAEQRSLADITTDALADQLSLVGSAAGGPARLFASRGAFGGAAQRPDYGQALVDLIQTTIAPDFWDVRGGPGTIVYYAPLHALVVRATSEVHHRIGGAVKGIRRVGN